MMTELRPWRRNRKTKLPSPPVERASSCPALRAGLFSETAESRAPWADQRNGGSQRRCPLAPFIDRSLQQELGMLYSAGGGRRR